MTEDVVLAPGIIKKDQEVETASPGHAVRTRRGLPNPAVGVLPEIKPSQDVESPLFTGMCHHQDLNMLPQFSTNKCRVNNLELSLILAVSFIKSVSQLFGRAALYG